MAFFISVRISEKEGVGSVELPDGAKLFGELNDAKVPIDAQNVDGLWNR